MTFTQLLQCKSVQYALGGLTWTGISFAIIFFLNYQGVSPYFANLIGYIVGLILSFTVQKYIIFKKGGRALHTQIILFLVNFLIAYTMNFIALVTFIYIGIWDYIAHVLSGAVYTFIFYLVSRYIVFR